MIEDSNRETPFNVVPVDERQYSGVRVVPVFVPGQGYVNQLVPVTLTLPAGAQGSESGGIVPLTESGGTIPLPPPPSSLPQPTPDPVPMTTQESDSSIVWIIGGLLALWLLSK